MNNFFNYVINLRDQMSGTLRRVGGSLVDTTNRVRGLRNEVRNLNSTPLNGLRNSISNLFNNIPFAQYIFNPLTIAGVVGGRALKLGMEQEMRNVSFEVLFKGEENAKKVIDSISEYAAKTPYGKGELSEAVQTMAGFGIAQERIMPNLKAIGDIAMGDKNKLGSLTLAFSQMSATGKLMGQDLLQMINAGFNPLEQMAKTTGKSLGQLKDNMSKGLLSSDMVTQAFQDATKEGGRFYGMVDKMSKTFGGQVSTALDNVNEKLVQLYVFLEPYLLPAIRAFNLLLTNTGAFVDKVVGKLEGWYNKNKLLASVIIAIAAGVAAYNVVMALAALKTWAWAAAQGVLNMELALNPLGLIIALIVGLIAAIAFLIIKVDGWGETWDNVLTMCKLGFEVFKNAVTLIWLKVQDVFLSGFEVIEKGWYKIQSLWDENAANAGLANLEAQRNERAKAIADTQGKLGDLAKQMSKMEVIKLKFNDTSFSDITKGLKSKLGIKKAGLPGAPTDGSGGVGIDGTGGTGGASGKAANSIATGGSKTTHVNITLGNLVGTMTVTAGDGKEAAVKVRDIVLDEMSRALSMAQANV